MLVGKPGVGKSTVAAEVAAKLTTGQLAGSYLIRPQTVLYSLTEDSEGTFKARFIAAGGNERVTLAAPVLIRGTGRGRADVACWPSSLALCTRDLTDPCKVELKHLTLSSTGLVGHCENSPS
jgi:hypothetical protein